MHTYLVQTLNLDNSFIRKRVSPPKHALYKSRQTWTKQKRDFWWIWSSGFSFRFSVLLRSESEEKGSESWIAVAHVIALHSVVWPWRQTSEKDASCSGCCWCSFHHLAQFYSAFRQKFPKLWTSVAHSFLQQIAQNKNWAHPKATTLPRICKIEMQQASLLYYSAKPQSGGILGCALVGQRHCTSEPLDSRRFVEACRA